jgi:hypothetical protein
MNWNVPIEMPKPLQRGAQRVTAAPRQRPWYHVHLSTIWILAAALGCLVFINIPGDRAPHPPYRFYHGWPYHYYERTGEEYSFWSFEEAKPRPRLSPRWYPLRLILNGLATFCIVALVACACELWIRRHGRLFRFGTRSLLMITALFAVATSFGVREIQRCYRQQRALLELSQLGSVSTRRELQAYDWLRSLFGDNTHGTVSHLNLIVTRPIERLPNLRAFEDLNYMFLELANVPDNVEQLAELSKLSHLTFTLSSIDPNRLDRLTALSEIPQLDFLWLKGDAFGDSSLRHISPKSKIDGIVLNSSKVTREGVAALGDLPSLHFASLNENVLREPDDALLKLSAPSVRFVGNQLAARDEERLRRLWPGAKVEFGALSDTGELFIDVVRAGVP